MATLEPENADVDMEDAAQEEEESESESEDETDQIKEIALQCVLRDDLVNLTVLHASVGDDNLIPTWMDASGMTLLHWAACNGSPKVLVHILKKYPNMMSVLNQWGEIPKQLAIRKKNNATVDILNKAEAGEEFCVPERTAPKVLRIG